MDLFLVPATLVWGDLVSAFRRQTYNFRPDPAFTTDGVFLVAREGRERGRFVAGLCFYPTSQGNYVFAENFVASPDNAFRETHRAAHICAEGLVRYIVATGRHPILAIRHKGLERIISKFGFQKQRTGIWTRDPVMYIPVAE